MPFKCWVPGCRSNTSDEFKANMFSFPPSEDVKAKWIEAVKRRDQPPTKYSKVCIKHFKPEDIVTETSGYDSKNKITITVPLKNYRLRSDAVPSIFDDCTASFKPRKPVSKKPSLKDNQLVEEKDSSETSVGSNMQIKNAKIPLTSTSDENIPKSPCKADDESKRVKKSPKKASTTTDRPIIAVIKAQDLIGHEESPEKMDEDSDSAVEQLNSSASSFSLPSPYKNLPNVSVCLKEEDRVPITRELKGVKRSPSTSSSSSSSTSTGSAEVQKTVVAPKRRKIEKPAPVVIGRQNDCYCWICHRENVLLCCITCPRAYHSKCAGEMSAVSREWVCPECQRCVTAETMDTRSSTLAAIPLEKLCNLLKLSLNKMKQRAPIAFHQPVSLEHYPLYPHYVIRPMDFSLLEKNVKQHLYGCTEAFLADVKWIAHNSCVFNGTQHPLSTNAKNLVKSCDQDMQEIEVCPDCFVHSVVRNKYWFSEVCRKPHPLVWAKLKGFPYWPAKVVRILDGNVDARFFGAHDRAWVPINQCYHLSKEMPTSSKPKKKGNYEVALDELNVHVHLLIQKFGSFEYAPYRTSFNPENKFLMHHGIDIDKAVKDDATFDAAVASPSKMRFHSPEKESRFSKMMELESEQYNSEDVRHEENQSDAIPSTVLQLNDKTSSFMNRTSFLLKERQGDECSEIEKDVVVNSTNINDEKKVEDKKDNSVEYSSSKKSATVSDSDQLRKLELALERIKGYVSLSVDSEKENDENVQVEEKEDEVEKSKAPETVENKEKKDNKILSSLFSKSIELLDIENNVPEISESVNVTLETTKKTDSFFLKLNETIESCKAKLGISEIPSDNESVEDENGSKSDDDDDNSSVSDENSSCSSEDEENSSVNEEVEDENGLSEEESEGEPIEVSDNENEDSSNSKVADKTENGENSDSESEENSNSELSDTDIEASDANNTSHKDLGKSDVQKNPDYEDSVRDLSSDNHDESCNNVEIDSSENLINDYTIKEISEESKSNHDFANSNIKNSTGTLNENENCDTDSIQIIENKQVASEQQDCPFQGGKDNGLHHTVENSDSVIQNTVTSGSFNDQIINRSSNVEIKSPSKSVDLVTPTKFRDSVHNQQHSDSKRDMPKKPHSPISQSDIIGKRPESFKIDEDDDIFICNSPVKKAPPVIVLDDEENEESSVSDTCAIISPPYSTSAESFSTEENSCKPDDDKDHQDASPEKSVTFNGSTMKETLPEDSKPELMKKLKTSNSDCENGISVPVGSSRKRPLSSEDNSDDEVQILQPIKKNTLTGAIRTFKKRNSTDADYLENVSKHNQDASSPSKTQETEKENLGNDVNACQEAENSTQEDKNNAEANNSRPGLHSFPLNIFRSPVLNSSHFTDKDKEILFLRSKLNWVLSAYRIQSWKSTQEREELRHNMNLVIMEMRACLESDKKQAIETLTHKFDQEKRQLVEETKRKQWCASCLMESRYSCCWNTSYCSIACQKRHFPEHRNNCSQLKKRVNCEVPEAKQNSSPSNAVDGNENKNKLIILSMKSADSSKPSNETAPASVSPQQMPVNKPQIQVLSSKSQLQISPATSIPSSVQFFVAPTKPQVEAVASTSNEIVEKDLDSATIINNVRSKACDLNTAISLLKKKNLESTLSFLKKKGEMKHEKKGELKQDKKEEKKKEKKDKEESNLEERYFPIPPKITFEGYDSVSPEPNLVIEEPSSDNTKLNSEEADTDIATENYDDVNPVTDIVLSDSDDGNNEMVNIGHGIEVKAKYLERCIMYGETASKLTRCLVDVIFPDIKLLATCSAFGQKSNVTKLTRAALPTRRVYAVIDYVKKRFPDASRSDIVLTINMKCKEARVILNRQDIENAKKVMARRPFAKEKESESTATTSLSTPSPTVTSPPLPAKTIPNVVCVKSSTSQFSFASSFNLPKKSVTVTSPNIMRCTPQLLIRPKPMLNTLGTAAYIRAPHCNMPTKKRETVRNLLANKMKWSMGNVKNDGTKVLMTLDPLKTSTSNIQQPVSATSSSATSPRPLIIIGGSHVNTLKPATPVQPPTLPVTSPTKK